jgi:hypothetical protein
MSLSEALLGPDWSDPAKLLLGGDDAEDSSYPEVLRSGDMLIERRVGRSGVDLEYVEELWRKPPGGMASRPACGMFG